MIDIKMILDGKDWDRNTAGGNGCGAGESHDQRSEVRGQKTAEGG
jgi:hypothetical protein